MGIATCPPGFFLPDSRAVRLYCLLVVAGGLWYAGGSTAQQITLTIERIEAPSVTARNVSVVANAAVAASIAAQIAEVSIAGQNWRDVRVACSDLKQTRDLLVCAQGTLGSPAVIPLSFSYSTSSRNLEIVLTPVAGEEWRAKLDSSAIPRKITLDVRNGMLARLNAWLPTASPRLNAGRITGSLTYSDTRDPELRAELALGETGFADDNGLHAGEKIAADLSLEAQRRGARWQWTSRIGWRTGDVFWQPFFVRGAGHTLTAAGVLDAKRVVAEQGRLGFAGIGDFEFSGTFDRLAGKLAAATVRALNVDVASSYEKLAKSILQGTALGDLRCEGHVDLALEITDGAIIGGDFVLKRVSVEDRAGGFALFGLDGKLPWRRDGATSAVLRLEGGEVLRLPFGAFDMPLEMRGIRVRMHDVEIPVLDGKLRISDFAIERRFKPRPACGERSDRIVDAIRVRGCRSIKLA